MPIVSLAQAKTHLNIDAGITTFDAELTDYLDSADAVVEQYVGPVAARAVTEDVGSGYVLVLAEKPVISLTSIVPTPGLGGTTYLLADFEVITPGRVRRLDGGIIRGPQRVTYQAGYSTIPANYRLAAQIVIGHLWSTQRGGGATNVDGEETQFITGLGFAVPRRAVQLLTKRRMVVL